MKLVRHVVSNRIFDLDDVDEGVVRCRLTGEVFDTDDVEPIKLSEVIGCGKREGSLMWCDECAFRRDTEECQAYRIEKKLTPTTVAYLTEKS